MDEAQFAELATETLQTISEAIETADDEYELEMDLVDGVLTIDLPDGGQYVINKHSPSQQIWVSSPESGASHFEYDEVAEQWLDSDGNELFEMLRLELKSAVGIDVHFS